MIQSKYVHIIAAIAICLALAAGMLPALLGNPATDTDISKSEPDYAEKIFGEEIISIEILADEKEWQDMLDNAASEQYISADVLVNGARFQKVGIRPKGNSSLQQVAQSDSDRYSFRLKFDEYIEGQTCFGLDSFVINNMLGDSTYMKEHVSYELMEEIGVNSPYCGYADVKVNGSGRGLYLAVEAYGDSYERRTEGDTTGMLYNVKSMDMGGMENGRNNPQAVPGAGNSGEGAQFPGKGAANGAPEDFSGRDQRSAGRGGGSLEYTDDASSSYGSIFGNVVGKGTEKDYQRVIAALKALSEGRDLEEYFDVDRILRYLAAHTVVVNLDSYSSSMAQNYYIYEKDGVVTILPWDYNLSWGGFQSGDASTVINFPVDTPVSGVEMSARPLIEKLFADPGYLELYHGYLQELIDNYFADGRFETRVNELDSLIGKYVKNDPTAFCTYEEYRKAVSAFITLGNLRAESVQGQLDGSVPSTTGEQKSDSGKLVPADGLNLSVLGTMGFGRENAGKAPQGNGGQGGPGGERPAGENAPDRQAADQGGMPGGAFPGRAGMGGMPGTAGTNEAAGQSGTSLPIVLGTVFLLGMAIFFTMRLKRSY